MQIQTRSTHKYVLVLVGVWFLFAVTFLIAYLRVGQSGKFAGAPFKFLTLEGQLENKR